MQGIQMHGFYGISVPMLLVSDSSTVSEVLSTASNGFSARLLNNLLIEAKLLNSQLYGSNSKFRFSVKKDSKQAENLIRFSDFNVAYTKALEDEEVILKDKSGLTMKGIDELNSLEGLGKLSGLHELNSLGALNETEELDGLSELDGLAGLSELTSRFTEDEQESPKEVSLESLADVNELGKLGSLTEMSALSETNELHGLDSLEEMDTTAEVGSLDSWNNSVSEEMFPDLEDVDEDEVSNNKILYTLFYDADFLAEYKQGNYEFIVSKIVNWCPRKIRSLKDVLDYASSNSQISELLEDEERCLATIERIEQEPHNAMTEIRRNAVMEELSKVKKHLADLTLGGGVLTEDVASEIIDKYKKLPEVIQQVYTGASGRAIRMTDSEFELMTALHNKCSEPNKNGLKHLDALIEIIEKNRDVCITNTPTFLETDFSKLSTKDMYSQLLTFNAVYRKKLSNYVGEELYFMCDKGENDCQVLLSGDGIQKGLLNLFTVEDAEKPIKDPKRYALKGKSNIPFAVEAIHDIQAISSKLVLGINRIPDVVIKKFIFKLYDSSQMLDLCRSPESFISLCKLYYFIRTMGLSTVLTKLGVFEMNNADEEMYTSEDWREFTSKFGILGFYNYPEQVYDRCITTNAICSNGKQLTIEKSKEKLRTNLALIERFLRSKKDSILVSMEAPNRKYAYLEY